MYTILTTMMPKGNVGDQLIVESAKKLISSVKNDNQFLEFHRTDDLSDHLDKINETRAIIMPHFGLREPDMHPNTYKLTDDLSKIKIPLIPIGIGWKEFPGDYESAKELKYSKNTLQFLKYVSDQVNEMICREYLTCMVLENNNIKNVKMGGDCAWYDSTKIGVEMKRPSEVKKIVFTTPYLPIYLDQAKKIIKLINEKFSSAEKICSLHAGFDKIRTDKEIIEYAKRNNFEIKDSSGDIDKINFYSECDLHIGYRCHGHIAFLRNRIPSILINEDGRGVGFSYTFGVGGFNGFIRKQQSIIQRITGLSKKKLRSSIEVDQNIPNKVFQFIEEEINSKFRRYLGVSKIIDDTYTNVMKPFIDSIP